MADLEVEILARPSLNFALEQAGVPVVDGVRVRNRGSARIEGARVVLQLVPDLGSPVERELPTLHPGEEVSLGVIDVRALPGRLRTVVEAERAQLAWRVARGDEILASGEQAIDVLAWNEWPGDKGPRGLLAVFVTPNHPVIAMILRRVRDVLQARTGDPAITGYQSRSNARALAQVHALYEVVQSLGISYSGLPASFEQFGQKVRLADLVMRDQLANCVDITLLVASALEQMGLRPLLVLVSGHAFPGVWLTEDAFPEEIVTDAARLRTLVELGDLVFFDSSSVVASPQVPLAEAVTLARQALAVDDEFNWAIDVRVARLDKLRPLPIRDTEAPIDPRGGAAPLAPPGILQEAPHLPVAEVEDPTRVVPEPLDQRLARWKERLLDLSLRNRLLAFRPNVKTALVLLVPDLALFADRLIGESALQLVPKPTRDDADERDDALVAERVDAAALKAVRRADLERNLVHTPFEQKDLLERGVAIERATRLDLEEGGANTLFVAIGFLRWFETDASKVDRLAPLLLVPVAIEHQRNARRLRVKRLPEEILPNYTLIERMRRDYGVDLSGLVELAADESGLKVEALLEKARRAIQKIPRWEVHAGAALGQFAFTKFLLWKDLDEHADVLLRNPVVQHVANGLSRGVLAFPNPAERVRAEDLDGGVAVDQLPIVVDADSTQMAAVHSALRGRSFVLQGPPGTGKSQTITNLIAAALAAGKTVLFVAEKMAALDVVNRRLHQAGLGDFCLELHSHKASKKEVVQALASTLQRSTRLPPVPWRARSDELAALIGELNAYVRALHAPRPLGATFYAAAARLNAARRAPALALPLAGVAETSEDQLRAQLDRVRRFAATASAVEPVAHNPWRLVSVDRWSSEGEGRIAALLERADAAGVRIVAGVGAVCAALDAPPTDDAAAVGTLLALGEAVSAGPAGDLSVADATWSRTTARARAWIEAWDAQEARRAEIGKRWQDAVYAADLDRLGPRFARWAGALLAFLVLWGARRGLRAAARARLPRNRQIARDLAVAQQVVAERDGLAREQRAVAELLGGAWDGRDGAGLRAAIERTHRLRGVLKRLHHEGVPVPDRARWLADPSAPPERRAAVRLAVSETGAALAEWTAARDALLAALGVPQIAGFSVLAGHVAGWRAGLPRFRQWAVYGEVGAALAGLGPLVQPHRRGEIAAADLVMAFERAFYQQWVAAVRDAEPALRTFSGADRHSLVERFRGLDRAHLGLATKSVVQQLEKGIPAMSGGAVSDVSEVGLILRESKKATRHIPVRRLLQEIPNLLPKLKPCLLMSPLSVVQYLPAEGRRFDLVIFDEASQIGTHDAIGALARGDQVIIVGDSRQLPPTSFFQRGADPAVDENDFVELESILDEAVAAGLPEEHLGWHYRSRHESLIQFSNAQYYDNRLNVFPAARGHVEDLGISWHRVPAGRYDKGKSRTNRPEAEALVACLVDELKRTAPGAVTFGVVTFSQTQQALLDDLLDEARRTHPAIEGHFGGLEEPVFVKNLENVQGDERDVILFSIGYGPDEHGKVSMNFGALNRPGGERRLNVAVTRARRKLRVFSSLGHEQIDLSRTRAVGARHLAEFLRYAERHGTADRAEAPAADFGSAFEQDVHAALTAAGHDVVTQVGCGAYRIDLAVRHPERPGEYLLGVELDGPAYGAAATARDRDRLRQEVLEGLGWRLHRIWSSDWWYDRDGEIARLHAALSETRPAAPAPVPAPVPVPEEGAALGGGEPYEMAELELVSDDPEALYHPALDMELRQAVAVVLRLEAPIHMDVLVRRVALAFGAAKLTERSRKRVMAVVGALRPIPLLWDKFIWPAGSDPLAWTRFRSPTDEGWVREPEELPVEEVAAAAEAVLDANLALPATELARETARLLLGTGRLGRKVAVVMEQAIALLLEKGVAQQEGERIVRTRTT